VSVDFSPRKSLFISLKANRWMSIDRMMEICSRILRVDDLRRRRNDPAVSELEKQVATDFGGKLRAARDKAGLTQEDLGGKSGVHRTVVGQLEQGHHIPRLDTIIKLAGGLGIEPCELMADVRWRPASAEPQGEFYKP
jgi:ribosome-binding protein aMBF1 (putative translation factor)